MPHLPQIKTFVEERASNYPNLDVENIRGKMPELVLEKADGTKERVAIEKWKTEHIEEFLAERLQSDK